ncbi:hypothetical protein [Sphingomonas montanisoli]|uniref:Uncharacterized protein n=1 Tax=Sphingomonas montanisoli TaxID=2606412 RepID=A0A5D9CC51_9SPHN|nr:hypothetical protein [Sphingomonas montanisoli]TZG27655.1 hypothetical protein FYJ91_08750 [Sphingomonas montanisoli]
MVDPRGTYDRAEEVLNRVRAQTSPRAIKAHRRRVIGFFRRLKIAIMGVLAVMLATGVIGSMMPIGVWGFLAMLVGMALVFFTVMGWPTAAEPTPEQIAKSDLPALPAKTERWLEAQRPALPAPAQRLADEIGIKLEAIGPQLATLDPREPAAFEFRKLIAEELPELVDGYRKLPEGLRRDARNGGLSPDRQLVEGLKVVDEELSRMSQQIASGDLNKLATQGRYLELKYRGDASEA